MGLDMYLASVLNPDDASAFDAAAAVMEPAMQRSKRTRHRDDFIAATDAFYDALRATGGYYREPYNPLGLFPLLGLSWDEVWAPLDDRTLLPVPHMRHLLAELEWHPITEEVVERGVEIVADDDPFKDSERMRQHLTDRHKGLMTLLQRAIAANEPLRVSA